MSIDAFERDLRVVLSARADWDVPVTLRQRIEASIAARPSLVARLRSGLGPVSFRGALGGAAGVTVVGVVVVVIGGLAALAVGRPDGRFGGGGGAPPIQWRTETVSFGARSISIHAGGTRFVGVPQVDVRSDAGNATYSTLEATWHENGTEMRLNLYFGADDTTWWVDEIRTSDGRGPAHMDWLTYRGPYFKMPLSEPFEGDVELASQFGASPGRLVIDDLRLAFAPFVPSTMTGCRPADIALERLPVVTATEPGGGSVVGPDIERDLSALGLDTSMTPRQAGALLRRRGICHTFRLEWTYTDQPNTGYAQVWCRPPEGTIEHLSAGSSGEIIVSVRGEDRPFAPNTPLTVGC